MKWLPGFWCWLWPLAAVADEGMWLFNRVPLETVRRAHGFEITAQWLDHLRGAAVRVGHGGSGSFVSQRGLVLTNHHVGAGTIERLSTPQRNLLRDGFYAAKQAEELRCPGLELSVLTGIEDVTARVQAAVGDGMGAAEAVAARRAVIARIEREAGDGERVNCQVVSLYRGALHHLYRFRRYTDVRLVFAPDDRAATFGGDPDNFEFPRFCLDCCFLRAYEDGEPARTPDFLKWNREGAAEGELAFVAGHPGRTNRSLTLAQLESLRDEVLPHKLERSTRTEALLRAWAERDVENARRARQAIVGTQNGRKALQARLDALLDPALMARKAAAERALREALRAKPGWRRADEAFDLIAEVERSSGANSVRERLLEGGEGFGTRLFQTARTLLRAAEESSKPDGKRLPEYRESARASLEHGLLAETPVYQDLEQVLMADALTSLCAKLGAGDPLVGRILAGKSPRERAAESVAGTSLHLAETRKSLYQGGRKALDACRDPMIELARLVDGEARALRERADEAAERIAQAHRRIAEARFELEGDGAYPDANGTLRLSWGVVAGCPGPPEVPPFTTFRGLRDRHARQGGAPPFALSEEWQARSAGIAADVRLNFISTHDITGGNSGSPMVNRRGELVGLVFDGNAASLASDFAYRGEQGRAVSVHPAAILEALRTVYRADRLVDELGQ